MGTLHLACCTGGTVVSIFIEYLPGMLPTVSKDVGKACFSEKMSNICCCKMVLK